MTLLVLSVLNVLIRHTGSSGAIPLLTFFGMLFVWFVTTIPLAFSGMQGLECGCIPHDVQVTASQTHT